MDFYGLISRLLGLLVVVGAALFIICGPEQQPAAEADLSLVPAGPAPASPVLAAPQTERPFANLEISSAGNLELEQAYLLINGTRAGSFSQGLLRVRVYDGDLLALDCTAYGRELTFYCRPLSASLDGSYLAERIDCCQEVATVGFAVIRRL